MTRWHTDWETNTEHDAGRWEAAHAPSRLEAALEAGYDPTEPDSPEPPPGFRGATLDGEWGEAFARACAAVREVTRGES